MSPIKRNSPSNGPKHPSKFSVSRPKLSKSSPKTMARFTFITMLLHTILFFSVSVSAFVMNGNKVQQQLVLGNTKGEGALVPGNAGLRYCSEGEEVADEMGIEYINLQPYPPILGQNLTIMASGFLNKTINQGAAVFLKVKAGYITVINMHFDLCEQSESLLGLKCPIPKGPIQIRKEVHIPEVIPPGKLTVTANATNDDGSSITCLVGKMKFPRPRR